ncbi:hypothetical protein C8J57DRAFT_1458652 [Mycena rebaudengoi]|nr:hypothetical protein C8J57DRAFT_1458652 [Mycena rebaudengoi]
MTSDPFFSGHHTTIHGGIGEPGGIGDSIGGVGGNGEGPQFNLSRADNWNVTVYGRSQHIFVLHGLRGSGKSQLAFKFLQDSQAHHRFSEIFYIDAMSEQTIETDLKIIAPAVVGGSAEASLHWLASKQEEWLLLFDNADDVQLDISKFFPHCTFGNILITTRNQELCIHASAGSRVSDMEAEDAKDLLLQLAYQDRSDKQEKLSSEVQEKLAVAIVKELHCFALAISQAGGYIHARGKLSGYLKLYQSHRDQLLQHVEIQRQDQYGLAVYATWNLSYKKLSSPGRTMLQICSSLHHKGILEQMFEKASMSQQDLDDPELQREVTQLLTALGKRDGNWDSFIFHGVMGELESYSLIEQDRQDDSYHIHPLVQHWSGTTMETNRHLMQKCVLAIIGLSIPWGYEDDDYKYRHKLLQHVTRSIDSLNREEICTFVATRIGHVYFEGSCWKKAEALYMVVMERSKCVLGEEHPDTLTSMAHLASTYQNQGRLKDAEALEVVVMEMRKRVLGEEHPDTLTSMANHTSTYRAQGRWKDAEVLEVVVMGVRGCVLGEEHPDTLMSMTNLACTYRNQGRWKEAEALQVVVMEMRKCVLGQEHPDTLTSMANLASTYRNQGHLKDAEELEVVVLEMMKHVLGEEHPSTLMSMANLASTYWVQGRCKNAEVLEVVVIEMSKHVLGEEHPDTLTSMANLASTYRNQGCWKDAEVLEVMVMVMRKCVLGQEHPYALTSIANLASTYQNQGCLKDAEELEVVGCWKDAEVLEVVVMEVSKRVLGEEHPDTLTSMANLASTYQNQGRWKDAEALNMIVMEMKKRVLGRNIQTPC